MSRCTICDAGEDSLSSIQEKHVQVKYHQNYGLICNECKESIDEALADFYFDEEEENEENMVRSELLVQRNLEQDSGKTVQGRVPSNEAESFPFTTSDPSEER